MIRSVFFSSCLRLFLSVGPTLFFASVAFCQIPSFSYHSFVICKKDKEVRTIRIEKRRDTGKYLTIYTKSAQDQEIGSGYNPASSLEVMESVQNTLVAAGWSCRKAAEATASVSENGI
ncbi:MAG: hypothetical protein N2578_08930 [Bdellovibrionaceae bacterium]|nr:hypothetical protein [Pseudobdellovibrionaceae bacterium]